MNDLLKLAEDFSTMESVPVSTDERTKNRSPLALKPTLLDAKPKIDSDGSKKFYNIENKLHRIGAPAVISPDGNQLYYHHGKLHREDGPAAIFFNGSSKWFINGKSLSPLEVLQFAINKGRLSTHGIDILKELADIAFFDYEKLDMNAIKHAGTILLEKGIISSRNTNNIVEYLQAVGRL